MDINELFLPNHTLDSLSRVRIDTVEKLYSYPIEKLLRLPHFGRKSLDVVVERGHRLGLRLNMTLDEVNAILAKRQHLL